ncbi:DUF2326 domain-containing protein [Shewanella frigidimarina]|jgi:uncharacterized protein YydD (DUF2326 family)|uniref:DUF2326 domain-containing protein n=1 Tax=Shewanella morhuae TaxID=365591 RepID=A0ABX5HQ30_9GAMM|nr:MULTISPECIES: DUF2326 domain-containing protein [Shewanella]PTA48954.1 DUF2326 domain-containing protein [Shewanella morhuae]RPA34118.1 DUF2326 domain-containing protein [Shewanella vesiculosa]UJL42168.1 DUF2326 domain-containing protein [Shewanella vesiculosa]|tara:strand:- start:5853 stop:7586 length:1734 start_codon:yes stop_codon:yes gene_type:complete
MKLLKLYSDNPDFKEIIFKPGLNIVAGLQLSSFAKDSYNGIGKSSSLSLLHLMFGGSFDDKSPSDVGFKSFLSSYGTMHLDFMVGSVPYIISKNFAESAYYLNNEKISKSAYPKKLRSLISACNTFDMNFKPLFNMFARRYLPGRNYYAGALTQQGQQPNDYYQMLYNLVLLGLDTSLITKNKKIAEDIRKLKNTEQVLNKQKVLINESDLLDLEEERDRLIEAKANFIIALNYDDLKHQADELTQEMAVYRNKIYTNEKDIRKRIMTLDASRDEAIDIAKITEIYKESEFHFPDKVAVRLKDAQDFHIRIQEARKDRLKDQISELRENNKYLQTKLANIEAMRDKILKDLDSKGALEEYNSIGERIRTLDADIAELTSYQTLLAKFEKDKAKLELDKATVKAESVKYLEEQKVKLKDVETKFRSFVKRFYTDHGGRLSVTNSKDAQYLYNIEPHIHKDGSQGVNEVKIFCYDLLLFSLNPNALGFLAHDSCIFSGMDPRQKATMFKVVLEAVNQSGLQYFVNMNKDTYEQILGNEGLDEDDECVLNNNERAQIIHGTVLELYDADPKHTLFGRTFG